MSSSQRLVAALRANRAVASDSSVRRVRHGLRDQVMVMAFSAALSLVLAALLALAMAKVGIQ